MYSYSKNFSAISAAKWRRTTRTSRGSLLSPMDYIGEDGAERMAALQMVMEAWLLKLCCNAPSVHICPSVYQTLTKIGPRLILLHPSAVSWSDTVVWKSALSTVVHLTQSDWQSCWWMLNDLFLFFICRSLVLANCRCSPVMPQSSTFRQF